MKTRVLFSFISTCLTAGLFAQLSGTYTVGGSNPDYTTITDAVNDLNSMGANGNVTFNIRPGTYTGQYELDSIAGTPGTTTFKSETNDPEDVVLEFDATGSSDNYILLIDRAANVTIQSLTFTPLDFTYAGAVIYRNNAHFLNINDCVFIGTMNNSGSGYFNRVLLFCDQNDVGTGDNPDNVTISGNTFMYGNTAMNLEHYGIGAPRADDLLVEDNMCIDQSGTGIWIDNTNNSICRNNTIKTNRGAWFTGIRMFRFGNSEVSGNRVEAYSTNGCTAFEYSNTQSTTGNFIFNNMFYANGETEVWGMAVFNLWGVDIQYNTAVAEGGVVEDSYAFYHLSNFADSETTEVENNIFANYGGGKALYTKVSTNIAGEDYNDLFTTGDTLTGFGGTGYPTLADHQAGTGYGANSVSMDPAFPHLPDLHLNSCALEGMAQPNVLVATDIDGDVRDASTPDMGADEFTFSSGTIAGPTINITSADLPYDLSAPNGSAYNWSTGDMTQTTQINMSGTYTCSFTDVNGCAYTVSYTVDVDISTDIEESKRSGLNVYPNPTRGTIWIDGIEKVTNYSVLDLRGSLVSSGVYYPSRALSVGHLETGLYLLQLEDENTTDTIRFQVIDN